MLHRYLMVVGAMALSACSSEAERAERQYGIMRDTGSASERCDASRKVAQAWLREEDKKKYLKWRRTSEIDCLEFEADELLEKAEALTGG